MLACDVVLFRSSGLIAKLIRWVTRDKGEPKTIVSHVGIMVSETEIVESKTKTVKHAFTPPAKNCWVYRKSDLTEEQRGIIVAKALEYVGDSYGWLKILAHAADHLLFRDRYVMRRLCRLDRYPICSWLVAYAYAKIGYQFKVPPWAATPDDIWDWVTTSSDWQIVV